MGNFKHSARVLSRHAWISLCATVTLLPLFISANAADRTVQAKEQAANQHLETIASAISIGSDEFGQKVEEAKKEFLAKLSPGARAVFLVNRRDYQQALDALSRLPNGTCGSAEYVRAMALEGLGKHKEAIAAFERAKAKIGAKFSPSPVFYLQLATPYLRIKDYDKASKYLAKAGEKELEVSPENRSAMTPLAFQVSRRTAFVCELKGQSKEAFDQYLSFFGNAKSQFHLSDPIAATPDIVSKAKDWLTKNKQPPGKHPIEQAKFYLTEGKAYLATGDLKDAKVSLDKASAMVSPDMILFDKRVGRMVLSQGNLAGATEDRAPEVRDSMLISHDQLVQFNDQASSLLVRLYVREKNYAQACKYIRRTFAADPADAFMHGCNVVHFEDVPELVNQKDLAVHSRALEQRLEHAPMILVGAKGTRQEVLKAVNPLLQHPLLAKARKQVEELKFADCLKTLDEYLTVYRNARPAATRAELEADLALGMSQIYRVGLFKVAVAYAANRRDVALSYSRRLAEESSTGTIWSTVERQLEGVKAPLSASEKALLTELPDLKDWATFASGVHFMKLGDYTAAAADFEKVSAKKGLEPALISYATALKKFCQSQKKSPVVIR